MKKQPFVSIVTPVYNGEKYLEECIQSVLSQTYDNWEYIIVNNKSTDKTREIAEKYVNTDKRIRIFDNENLLPVMQNFNNAIRQVSKKSTYCKLICADDWIYPDYLEKTVALAEENTTIGIVSSYRLVGDRILPVEPVPYKQSVFIGKDVARMNLLYGPYTFGSPTALLYRSVITFRKDKFFNEVRTSGDTEACYEALKDWNFGFVPQILSYTRLHDQTVTSKVISLGKGFPDHISMLKIYGQSFLNNQEISCREKELFKEYYTFLGRNPLKLKDKGFREFHRTSFKNIGVNFEWKKVLITIIFEVGKNVIDFKSHAKRLSKLIHM